MQAARRALTRPVTLATLCLLILVFLLSVAAGPNAGFAPVSANPLLGPSANNLVHWGARVTYLLDAQPWRVVSAGLLHAGLVHLLLNSIALWQLGGALEILLLGRGSYRALLPLLLLATSVCGMLASALFLPATVSVGASAGIMGLCGVLIAEAALLKQWKYVAGLIASAALNLVISAALPLVDNFAHVAGLLAGLALGTSCAAVAGGLLTSPSPQLQAPTVLPVTFAAAGTGLVPGGDTPSSAARLRSPASRWSLQPPGAQPPPHLLTPLHRTATPPVYCLDVITEESGAGGTEGVAEWGEGVRQPPLPHRGRAGSSGRPAALWARLHWPRTLLALSGLFSYCLLVGLQARALHAAAWTDPSFCPGCRYVSCIPSAIKSCD